MWKKEKKRDEPVARKKKGGRENWKEIDKIDKSFKLCSKLDSINVMYIMAGIRENELLVAGTW
jgi:hypothetical protein